MAAPGCQALALVEHLDSLEGVELRGLERSHKSPVCLMPWSSSEKGISRDVASMKQIPLSSAVLRNLTFLDKPTYTQELQESNHTIRKPRLGSVSPQLAERADLIYGNKHPPAQTSPSQPVIQTSTGCPALEIAGAEWARVCVCVIVTATYLSSPLVCELLEIGDFRLLLLDQA